MDTILYFRPCKYVSLNMFFSVSSPKKRGKKKKTNKQFHVYKGGKNRYLSGRTETAQHAHDQVNGCRGKETRGRFHGGRVGSTEYICVPSRAFDLIRGRTNKGIVGRK